MPVWHRFTRELREMGVLNVVGIVQEQHPDRAQLFAQWQGIDWPLLWDPFNLTGSKVVPLALAVDEGGVVRKVRPARESFEEDFLAVEYPFEDPPAERDVPERIVELDAATAGGALHVAHGALSDLLWRRHEHVDAALEALEAAAVEHPDRGHLAFRAGVARRMRYDSERGRPEDFQASLDHWARALALDPNQYIWRRRIQQYGPRPDKPYPYYDWVDEARRAIAARGEEPIRLPVELTPAELAAPRRELPGAVGGDEPDPEGRIARDAGLVAVESAVAFATDARGKDLMASVHLAFRPDPERDAHWNNEVEPMRVWIGAGQLPIGVRPEARLLERALPAEPVSSEVRRFSLDVALGAGVTSVTLPGYALFHACEGADGTCLYLRRDFEVRIEPPR